MSIIYRVVDTQTGRVLPDNSVYISPTGQVYVRKGCFNLVNDQSRYKVQRGFEYEGQKFYEGDRVTNPDFIGSIFTIKYRFFDGWCLVDQDKWMMVIKETNISNLKKVGEQG